jgi:hypothetical protein
MGMQCSFLLSVEAQSEKKSRVQHFGEVLSHYQTILRAAFPKWLEGQAIPVSTLYRTREASILMVHHQLTSA